MNWAARFQEMGHEGRTQGASVHPGLLLHGLEEEMGGGMRTIEFVALKMLLVSHLVPPDLKLKHLSEAMLFAERFV